ncbi:MAG: bifunctional DNA-formamidopyrimidine glycosylase/DNA-(apurinic or apyrimidinic site) lyase [Parcubacteria group bacterium]|jgi:formamidopyrimidine-DNA glycosylase
MPELPEVETITTDLNQKVKGLIITKFWSDFPSAIKGTTLLQFQREMKNKKILSAQRVGKNIFLHLSGGKSLHIHLRMTGHLLVKLNPPHPSPLLSKERRQKYKKSPSPYQGEGGRRPDEVDFFNDKVNQYIHHIWYLNKNKTLEFSDLRKFATMRLLETNSIKKYLAEKKIGIDAMSEQFTLTKFNELLDAKPKMLIGIFLLDQSIISGIGNIYRSEILFASGVLPERKNESLEKDERKKIFLATKKILKLAIKMRGTSDSDYRDSDGAPGHFQEMLKVYRRDKLPCPAKCGGLILRKKMAQRSVFFCAKCQK